MANPKHDAVVDAFQRVAASLGHPMPLRTCERGPKIGYTNIHRPNQPPLGMHKRCTNHVIGIEKTNGTVALHEPIGERLGALKRPKLHIKDHPLGGSAGTNYGKFGYAFEYSEILKKWETLDAFARVVIAAFKASSRW